MPFTNSAFSLQFLNYSRQDKNLDPSLLNSTYCFWKEIWTETFAAAHAHGEKVDGDRFNLIDEIGVLISNSKPVALLGLRHFDLRLLASMETSYMQTFSVEAAESIKNSGYRNVTALVGLTIASEARNAEMGLSLKDLIVSLMLKQAKKVDTEAVIAFTRNNRGINKLFERFGAASLIKNKPGWDSPIDVMLLEWSNYKETPSPQVAEVSNWLWRKHLKSEKAAA